jgi:tetratricopeptide (TPR) repeat protein
MDEWHIGDPVDWGDGWMDAQNWGRRDNDEDEEEDNTFDNTQFRINEYSKKAWDYYMDFKDEDALYYINLALDLDNRHANNWNRKAIILESLKRYEESEECYNRSLRLSRDNIVSDNKARMLLTWSHQLLEESKNLKNGLCKLEEAEDTLITAIHSLSPDSDEDKEKYFRMRDSILFSMDYEKKFQKNLETLKKYDKSELFTITKRGLKNKVVITSGMPLKLVKEPDNEFDKDAIAVYAQDVKIGYVANKDYTKYELTSSASQLQDKIDDTAEGAYLFYLERYSKIQFSIGRIIR